MTLTPGPSAAAEAPSTGDHVRLRLFSGEGGEVARAVSGDMLRQGTLRSTPTWEGQLAEQVRQDLRGRECGAVELSLRPPPQPAGLLLRDGRGISPPLVPPLPGAFELWTAPSARCPNGSAAVGRTFPRCGRLPLCGRGMELDLSQLSPGR